MMISQRGFQYRKEYNGSLVGPNRRRTVARLSEPPRGTGIDDLVGRPDPDRWIPIPYIHAKCISRVKEEPEGRTASLTVSFSGRCGPSLIVLNRRKPSDEGSATMSESPRVNIALIEMPPLCNRCALDAGCPQKGLSVDVAEIVCRLMSWNCTFEWFGSSEYGDVDDNGTASGLVAAIRDGRYDTSLPVFTPTYRRFHAIDFSHPYFHFDTVLATRMPSGADLTKELDWAIVRAFEWRVWAAFAVLLVLSCLFFTWFTYRFSSLSESDYNIHQSFWASYVEFGMDLVQAEIEPEFSRASPFRVCYGVWLLCSIVLTSSYTGMLFSQKVVLTKVNPPFVDLESFAECLDDGRCRLITHTESISFFQQLTVPGTPLAEKIGRAITKYPVVVTPLDEIPRAVLKEKRYYLVWQWPREWVYYSTQGNKDCGFYIVDTPFVEVDAFPTRKNSSLKKHMDTLGLSYRETGLNVAMKERYFRKAADCSGSNSANTKGDAKSQENGLDSLMVAFCFYALGTGLGIVAMPLELLVWNGRPSALAKGGSMRLR